ncbi:diguanylate cyclase domain-containing protein [Actinoplanes sp. NPDC051494]|uniref:diguanylate cyclase domain-containing protein n=1 Tax=Actinoplanes sp. NPDC051494 TaxID=3363907 RepID=UPI0037AEE82D
MAQQRALRRDPLLIALVVLILVSFSGFVLRRAPAGAQVAVFWLLMAGVQGFFAVTSWRVANGIRRVATQRRAEVDRVRAGRRMWRLFSAAGGVLVLGNVIQLGVVTRDATSFDAVAGSTAQVVSILAGIALMIAGLLGYPLGGTGRSERLRLRIDVATVMAAAATFGLWVLRIPAGPHDLTWALTLAASALVQPGLFLVAIFAVVRMMLGGRSPFTPAAGAVYGVAAVLQTVLQAVPIPMYLDPGAMPWLFAGNVAGSGLIAIGARVQELQARAATIAPGAATTGPGAATADRPYSPMPYGAMAAVWCLTFTVLVMDGLTWRSWLVVGGAAVTTALVTARQIAAFRHIGELLRERDELTARLTDLAYHDSLTGLGNRGLFMRRLHEALAVGAVTVYLIDLDDFKPINDAYGHATGDQLLIQVAERLRACVRTGDLVARLGGDEFAVLVEDLPPERRTAVADDLTLALHGTLRIGPAEVALSASVGMATGRHGEHDPDSLLHEADMAMYATKDARRELLA